ncbi:hypothetical protein C8R44DRAFT_726514 [Mycena epipterygia]|nr:hypothetical protein C8R44DRAFT_726514 [Mycena epipterygia]
MVSILPGSLSKSDEAIVRKLFKVLRATKYEDPVDQDAFLVESAGTVLQFRPFVTSFALDADLGECVFTLRAMMHANNAHLGTPSSATFVSIQDFAGEILRKRQTFHARKRANEDRIRVAEGMAARIERNIALGNKPPASPDDDTVSIPLSSDESGTEEIPRPPKPVPPSPIQVDPGHSQPGSQVRSAALLSPLGELGVRLGRLSLGAPPRIPIRTRYLSIGSTLSFLFHTQPSSPLSPSLSLPDLVPDFTLVQRRLPVKGDGWKRGRTVPHQRRNFPTPGPVVQCNYHEFVPCPFDLPPPPPKNNFVDDWLLSKPKFAVSPRPRRSYIGNSKPFVNPNRSTRRPPHKKLKRCYYCTASDHLVALCPLREAID